MDQMVTCWALKAGGSSVGDGGALLLPPTKLSGEGAKQPA